MISIRPVQNAGEHLPRIRFFPLGNLLGRALRDDAAAAFAAFGAEVDDPVGLLDYVEVVLDDEDGVAEVGEAVQDVEEFFYVVEVQAGGGLVQNVQSAAGLAFGKLFSELDALRLAAGKRGGGLAQLDVAEADVDQRFDLYPDLWDIFQNF